MLNIYKTALQAIWADRATMWSRLWLPSLLFSLLLVLLAVALNETGQGLGDFAPPSPEAPKPKVGIINNGNGEALIKQLKTIETVDYQRFQDADTVAQLLEAGTLDLAIEIDASFDDALATGNTGEVLLYHEGYNEALKTGIADNIAAYEREILNERLEKSNFSDSYIDPINVMDAIPTIKTDETDKTPVTEATSETQPFNEISAILLGLIYFFCWSGSVYPALALFAEPALNGFRTETPRAVLLAKVLAVATFSMLQGLFLWAILAIIQLSFLPPSSFYGSFLAAAFAGEFVPFVLLQMLVLSLLFAAFSSWATLKRGTFKATENRLQPLKISVGMLLFSGLMGGLDFSLGVAFLPLINIGTATHLLLSYDFRWLFIGISLVSTLIYAYLSLLQALKIFEQNTKPLPLETATITENPTSEQPEKPETDNFL